MRMQLVYNVSVFILCSLHPCLSAVERSSTQFKEHVWSRESEDWRGSNDTFAETVDPKYPSHCHPGLSSALKFMSSQLPESLLIPYGRVYVAMRYGVALYLDKATIPQTPRVGESYLLVVRTCLLPAEIFDATSVVHDLRPNGECGVSLYARLLGPEVVMANVELVETSNESCEWRVQFPEVQISGSYKLEIHKLWLNELGEPSQKERDRDKNERVNDGQIINLSGMGTHHFYTLNGTDFYYTDIFEGLIARPSNGGKALYIISNKTNHMFGSWNAFVGLGYDTGDVVSLPDAYFWSTFKGGHAIESIEANEQFRRGVVRRSNVSTAEISQVVAAFQRQHILTFESRAHFEARVFGLPSETLYISENAINVVAPRHVCTSGDEPGRWTFQQTCRDNVTIAYLESQEGIGHECRHGICPVYEKWDFDLKTRLRHHVWRPYKCSLVQFRSNALIDPKQSYCDNIHSLAKMVAEGGHISSSISPNVFTPHQSSQPSLQSPVVKVDSMLAYALRSAGIAAIAGFGDSLGEEQRDNILNFLGGPWGPANSLDCMGSAQEHLHQLVDPEFRLALCVEAMANRSVGTTLLFTAKEQSTASAFNNTMVNMRTVVLVTNFMSQHSVWIHGLAEIVYTLNEQAKAHEAVTRRLKERGIEYRKIFMASVFIHGFKTGGLTPARSRFFNDQARKILGAYGWEILDGYNITMPRPDGSVDGVHPRGGVSIAITDVLLNMIVNKHCAHKSYNVRDNQSTI